MSKKDLFYSLRKAVEKLYEAHFSSKCPELKDLYSFSPLTYPSESNYSGYLYLAKKDSSGQWYFPFIENSSEKKEFSIELKALHNVRKRESDGQPYIDDNVKGLSDRQKKQTLDRVKIGIPSKEQEEYLNKLNFAKRLRTAEKDNGDWYYWDPDSGDSGKMVLFVGSEKEWLKQFEKIFDKIADQNAYSELQPHLIPEDQKEIAQPINKVFWCGLDRDEMWQTVFEKVDYREDLTASECKGVDSFRKIGKERASRQFARLSGAHLERVQQSNKDDKQVLSRMLQFPETAITKLIDSKRGQGGRKKDAVSQKRKDLEAIEKTNPRIPTKKAIYKLQQEYGYKEIPGGKLRALGGDEISIHRIGPMLSEIRKEIRRQSSDLEESNAKTEDKMNINKR